jgi:putative adenylate-forming enzyme
MRLNLLLQIAWKQRHFERSCRWTLDELKRHQTDRLAELRRFAIEKSPFYRHFHRGLEARPLEDLPILTKSILMDNFDDWVTDRAVRLTDVKKFLACDPGFALFRERYVVVLTSGTTGVQGIFLFDPDEWVTAMANLTRPMAWVPTRQRLGKPWRTATIASTTPWHFSARAAASLSTRWLLRLDAAEPLDSLVGRLNLWQPQVLAAYPSVLRQLAEEQMGGRLHLRLERIGTSAEVLTEEIRRRIHEAWGLKPYDTYAATEYAPIGAECAHGGKHLVEDGAIIEIVDEHGRAVPPGVCGDRVLISVFGSRTQPLIRYEISDRVRLIAGECDCGRKFRLIEAIEGRMRDILTFPHRDGGGATVTVHAHVFYPVLENVPATAWQVIHDERGLWISLTGLRNPHAVDEIETSIRHILEQRGALIPTIHVREVTVLERGATGKAPMILSRIPR